MAVLETASDIAKGMLHLHNSGILHSDLKAGNVMLKSDGGDGRGVIAKVSDFGLAVQLVRAVLCKCVCVGGGGACPSACLPGSTSAV